jgi:isopentenyldiphosphate isomerase
MLLMDLNFMYMKTTDPQDEMFPIVDKDDNVIGKILRAEANTNPNIIHRDAGVIVFNNTGEVLIQRRSKTKDTFPDCLDISVGGHVNYGEEYINTAVREAREELGISISKDDLKLLGKVLIEVPWEKEFWQIYSYQITADFKPVKNEEVAEVQFMSLGDIKKSFLTERWSDKAKKNLKAFVLN